MAYTLQNSINYAATMIQYAPQTSGLGQEPAVTVASMIRGTILSAPFVWPWNRAELNANSAQKPVMLEEGVQDYTLPITNFGFIEKASLTDSDGKVYEIKDVMNIAPLAVASSTVESARPAQISALVTVPYTSVMLRFSPVPDQAYTLNLTYQQSISLLGPYFITSANSAAGGNTVYNGIFDVVSFPVGSTASVTGFVANLANNGLFSVVAVTPTTLTLANGAGVAETISAYVSNFNWSPIPDSFNYIYNTLYMGEIFAMAEMDQMAQLYRQRGAALLLGKAEGLTETQKNIFMQQWLARGISRRSRTSRTPRTKRGAWAARRPET